MSVLFSIAFILAIHFLRGRSFFLKSFGAHTLLVMYRLCLFRMVSVLEMPFTFPEGLRGGFSQAYAKVRDIQIPAGSFQSGIWDLLDCIWLAALFARLVWREHDVRKNLAHCAGNRSSAAEQPLKKVQRESARKVPVSVRVCSDIDRG